MFFITGATSSGKTSLALKICEQVNAEIVSADSRQIYKYFDVGTGKLPINLDGLKIEKHDNYWKINCVTIWMYDVADPDQVFSVSDYKKNAQKIIEDIKSRGKIPLIVGGTGLYIDALLGLPVMTEAEPDWDLREDLSKKTLTELLDMLPVEVKAGMNESDIKNPRRLIRRIEILKQGAKVSSMENIQRDFSNVLVMKRPRESIYKRADQWCDSIWPALLQEVGDLKNKGFETTVPMQGIIYKTAFSYLNDGILSEAEARERIKFDLHHYIRRQETWFKRYSNANIIDPTDKNFDSDVLKIVELVKDHEKNKFRQ